MNSVMTLQEAPTGWGGGDVTRCGGDPGQGGGVLSHAIVIDRCAFAREAMVSLVTERYTGEVSPLDSGSAYLQWPLAERLRPVSLLVYRLPTALPSLLEAVCFLRRFLTLHQQDRPSEARPPMRVIVLTDLPPFWLYDTLHSQQALDDALLSVSVLPAHCRPQQLRTVLSGMASHSLLVHLALKTPVLRRARGLSVGEVDVMRSLLLDNLSIVEQAQLRGRNIKTLYSQRLSAMRKLGVRTLSGLLRWSVCSRRGKL